MEVTATSNSNTTTKSNNNDDEEIVVVQLVDEEFLPMKNWMSSKVQLKKIQNFWYPATSLSNILTFQTHFLAQDTDLIVASFPKTGTTWLKSLLFSIVNRSVHPPKQSPLLTHNPHELVYDLETGVYGGNPNSPRPHQLKHLPSPQLLHSHLPYASLPESIKANSKCKILYICRNPLDTLVSHWNFFPYAIKKMIGPDQYQPPDISVFFEDFCEGNVIFGPYFEHVVGYWKQSCLKQANKQVLFLRYEDLKEDPSLYVKKIAEFVDVPFSDLEENEGVVEEIVELCSFNKLKELEVNKSGMFHKCVENKTFFREGEVGGWRNYFTAPMVAKMNMLMEQKFGPIGLSFSLLPP